MRTIPFYEKPDPVYYMKNGFGAIKMIKTADKSKQRAAFTAIFLFMLVWPVFSASKELSQTTIVVTMGTGEIINAADATNARERAISDALVSAVENILSGILPVESLVANFKTLNAIIYQNKEGLIQEYKVLAEEKSGKYYRVMLESTVLMTRLMQLLVTSGLGTDQTAMPGILFLIAEENLEDVAIQYWWGKGMKDVVTASEAAISEALQKKGFSVIDHLSLDAGNLQEDGPSYNANPDHLSMMELASKYQADVVIIGTTQAVRSSNTMDGKFKSFTGKLSLKVYRADSGTEIASTEKTAVLSDGDEISGSKAVLTKVAMMAAQDLAPMILSGWLKSDKKESEIVVSVQGTNELSHFVAFRETLNKTEGVKGIQLKEMESGKTTLLVRYQGGGKDLANALLVNTFEHFGLNITILSQDSIKVEMIPVSQ